MSDITDHNSRYIFHGHAAAFGGQLIRPNDIVLESTATASLTPSGGRSRGTQERATFRNFFTVGTAVATADGWYEQKDEFKKSTDPEISDRPPRIALKAITHVRTELKGLQVGGANVPQLRIGRIVGGMISTSPRTSGEPELTLDADTAFESVTIGGKPVTIRLNLDLFNQFKTRSKLVAAIDDPAIAEKHASHFFLRRARGSNPRWFQRLAVYGGAIYASLVSSIEFDGKVFKSNALNIRGLGRLYFGEILISQTSRRVTLLRMELGSPDGGDASCCDYQDNGTWGY